MTYAEDNITITSQKSVNDKIENLNQYFWFEETGTHAGAHITEVPQDDFKSNPQGGNLLATSNGLAVRDGTTELATFGANGVVIGQLETGKSRSELSASGMQVIQKGSGATDVPIANLGYGQGLNASGGLSDAPYYTLGVRKANSGIGNYSNAEGYNTEASGYVSHAEGRETTSSGYGSHSEGYLNDASGRCAHAEGNNGEASGDYGSHSEGAQCVAGGDYGSHAEGFRTEALGDYGAHAQNWGTKASSRAQTALGKFNEEDTAGTYAVILGNGTSDANRSNALTVDWNGNVDITGEFRVNGTPIGGGGADYITEQNTANGWFYRKWNSGLVEMWCTVTITAQTNSSDAGGYVSASPATPQNFPFTFTEVPYVQVTCDSGGVTGSVTSSVRPSTTSAGSWKLYRNSSNTNAGNKNFMFYVVGTI